jgi:hypothetical protein
MDIKAVTNYLQCIIYLTKYVNKFEKLSLTLSRIMKQLDTDIDLQNKSMLKYIAKLLMSLLGERDYSEQEIML